jgi:hypothetical protein
MGTNVKGDVTDKKLKAEKNRCTMSVMGELTAASIDVPGRPLTPKNAEYIVKGEQTYDLDQREWSSGKLTIEVSMELFQGKQQIAAGGEDGSQRGDSGEKKRF